MEMGHTYNGSYSSSKQDGEEREKGRGSSAANKGSLQRTLKRHLQSQSFTSIIISFIFRFGPENIVFNQLLV